MKKKLFLALFLSEILCTVNHAQDARLWATYYGGTNEDRGLDVTTDASGNVYVTGRTDSPSGIASGGFQNTYGGGTYDAFLVKFDQAGNTLWSTYFGGTGWDEGFGVTTDTAGNIYLTGFTDSPSGIASGGFQNFLSGASDAFLVKFSGSGNLLWATYYGGNLGEAGFSVATDISGNVYLSGHTYSFSGLASGGFQNIYGGGSFDAFLAKFDPTGNRIWATYYGGTDGEEGLSIATDNSANIYLAGYTDSPSGIAASGFQNTYGGLQDAYLVKFDSTGNRLWATYYGGTQTDNGLGISTDALGNVYLAGETVSSTGIASGGFQNSPGGSDDAFLVKFDSSGSRLWATYYGGTGGEYANGVTTDIFGNVFIAGMTSSNAGVVSGGFQNTYAGGSWDAYVVKFNSAGIRLCASYFGGTLYDYGCNIATDTLGNVYLTGLTSSTAGIASGGFQNTFAGGTFDAFLVKFSSCLGTSINEIEYRTACNIYPNPFSTQTVLETKKSLHNATLTVANCFGQTVAQIKNIHGQTIILHRDNLPNGMYFVNLTQDNKVIVIDKLIITE